jgi:1,4-alpha-glucan branching enzyme
MANRAYDDYRIGFPREGFWRVRLNSDWQGYSLAFTGHASYDTVARPGGTSDPMPCGASIGLGPYSCLVLSQDD